MLQRSAGGAKSPNPAKQVPAATQKATSNHTNRRTARCGASVNADKDKDTEPAFLQPTIGMRRAPPKDSERTNFGRSKRSSPRIAPDSNNPGDAPDLRPLCTKAPRL